MLRLASSGLIREVTHDVGTLLKVPTKIGTAEQLQIVCEAGPTGFGLQRALTAGSLPRRLPAMAPGATPIAPGLSGRITASAWPS